MRKTVSGFTENEGNSEKVSKGQNSREGHRRNWRKGKERKGGKEGREREGDMTEKKEKDGPPTF